MSLLGRNRSQPQPDSALVCPREGSPLEKVEVAGATIDRCGTCRGAWFDEGELRRVSGERALEREASRERRVPLMSGLTCPRCRGECHVAQIEEVQVDACRGCGGVWLDGGELEEARRQVQVNRILSEAGPGFRGFLRRL